MGFDPCNRTLKIQESIWDSNSHNKSSLGRVRVHSLTLFALLALPKASDVTLEPLSWPAILQPPCLSRKPKDKVATIWERVGSFPHTLLHSRKHEM
jgi:hypothetical protein